MDYTLAASVFILLLACWVLRDSLLMVCSSVVWVLVVGSSSASVLLCAVVLLVLSFIRLLNKGRGK